MIPTDQISNPILGLNAIKHIAQTTDDKPLIKLFQTSFDHTDMSRIQAFVNLQQTPDPAEPTVKVKEKSTIVPAGCIVEVPCTDSIMMKKCVNNYFKVPLVNSSDYDVILKKKMIMGRVEPIKSLLPLEVKLHQHSTKVSSIKACWEDTEEVQVTEEQQKSDDNSSPTKIPTVERQQRILSKTDLSGLTSKQREMVRNVIREECEVFSERERWCGRNRTYPIEINLKENNPVQLN